MKSCIYSIYGWMGVVGKYTGCFPLPGLYENREWSKWTKAFINYVIPALNFAYLSVCITLAVITYSPQAHDDLTDILVAIIDACVFSHFILCIVFNHFILRRELVAYLKLHRRVDELLKRNRKKMKSWVSFFFVLLVTFQAVHSGIMNVTYYFNTFFHKSFSQMLRDGSIRLLLGYVIVLAIHTHPHLMYVVFQHVLKTAFNELLDQIKSNKNENLSSEMRVKEMRKYFRLYGDLCQLSTRLDRLVSPLLIFQVVRHFLAEIQSLTFITTSFDMMSVIRVEEIIAGFSVLICVSNVAYLTKKSHDDILPAIYSTFNSEEKAVKTELQNFALQSMYFNKSFSASGFVKLDRNLILAIFQSVSSQVVVFYKIHTEKGKSNTYFYKHS